MIATKYKVVRKWDPEDLETGVNKLLAEGWQPWGGITISRELHTTRISDTIANLYIQAMVRPDGPPPKPDREAWIAKRLDSYQKYYRENGRYYIEADWQPTLEELKESLNKSYDFEVGE